MKEIFNLPIKNKKFFLKLFKYYPFISLVSYIIYYIETTLFMYFGIGENICVIHNNICYLSNPNLLNYMVSTYNFIFVYMASIAFKYCKYHRRMMWLCLSFSILFHIIQLDNSLIDFVLIYTLLNVPFALYNFKKLKNSQMD